METMKLIEQEVQCWGVCPTDKEAARVHIDKCGRQCYRSEPDSDDPSILFGKLVRRKHTAMVEHSNLVYRTGQLKNPVNALNTMKKLLDSKFLDYCIVRDCVYVGGNWRAWAEAKNINADYDNLPEVTFSPGFPNLTRIENEDEIPMVLQRVTMWFLTSRAVSHELVRHRPCSFAQESQRYCRYNGYLEYIIPEHYLGVSVYQNPHYQQWVHMLERITETYQMLLHDEQPQQARHILPNCTATRIIMTTTIPHWRFIFSLRCAATADPNMQIAMKMVEAIFKEKGWV